MKLQNETDAQLLQKTGRGDRAAFDLFLLRHLRRTLSYIYQYTGDWQTAEDIAQHAFMEAYQHANRFQPDRNALTWLFTIVHHRTVDHIRKPKMETVIANDEMEGMPNPKLLAQLSDQELSGRLHQSLPQLADVDRALLYLKYQQQLKSKDIALITDLQPGYVNLRISRARKKLRLLVENKSILS